jgi:hypothetical protein
MHEIAEAASIAFPVLILATASLTEIGYGGELCVEWPACVGVGGV